MEKGTENAEEKQTIVNKMVEKYAEGARFEPATSEAVEAIAIIEVSISVMTGKIHMRRL